MKEIAVITEFVTGELKAASNTCTWPVGVDVHRVCDVVYLQQKLYLSE